MRFNQSFKGLIFALMVAGCVNRGTHDMERYFESEIVDRLSTLQSPGMINDTLQGRIKYVHGRVGELILLSKDIENLGASISLSNAFFKDVAADFGMNAGDFAPLYTDMHVDEIAVVLRQNELNFLNQMLFRHDPKGKTYTAQ
jgi:hypothetical protein